MELTTELPLFAQAKAQPKHLTVTELTNRIRGIVEPAFLQVWIQGEVSNYRPTASGHAYFSLKDSQSMVSAAIFGWGARKKKFELKDGLQVLCRGKVTLYPPRGSYQLTIDMIEPLGAGALQLAFEQLKEKLEKEGLFDPKRKRPLPEFPKQIAVITSPTGSVIRDILNVLKRRAPQIKVIVIPAQVQGEGAHHQIIKGLQLANTHKLGDLVILARGGGSLEDLWCFNEEALIREISNSVIPVVSAVGHETDFTLSDFVSDLRAPTPSAAAEIISLKWVDAISRISDSKMRLNFLVKRDITHRKKVLEQMAARLVSPRDRLREQMQKCDELFLRLERSLRLKLDQVRLSLEKYAGKLDALSPLKVLERGYSIVRNPADSFRVVRSVKQVQPGQKLEIKFTDGNQPIQVL
jgi:exodeoxyribonuclease VII large subunit